MYKKVNYIQYVGVLFCTVDRNIFIWYISTFIFSGFGVEGSGADFVKLTTQFPPIIHTRLSGD
jgi:hypothetical protein